MAEKALTLLIQNKDKLYMPAVKDGVTWELSRKGTPGKLTFTMLRDDTLEFEEGNIVEMSYGSTNLFKGYIFAHKEDKNGVIQVTAYDQLRYLKNKDIRVVENKKASDVIVAICDDYKLVHKTKTKDDSGAQVDTEAICDTHYCITKLRSSNQTLFDTIQLALDHTLLYDTDTSGNRVEKMYVLYDDFGVINLKEIGDIDVPLLIDAETAQNFDFESSIDKDTYNRIMLYEDDKDSGQRVWYPSKDSANEARWGILSKVESINRRSTVNPWEKSMSMLKRFNAAKKTLSIKGAFGDARVRAGSRVWVRLNVKDPDVKLQDNKTRFSTDGRTPTGFDPITGNPIYDRGQSYDEVSAVHMMVERVRHRWESGNYTMDLTLIGRGVTT